MGYSSYSTLDRSMRSTNVGYATKSINQIFQQQSERKSHAEMSSKNIDVRECRDSDAHPNTVPLQLYLDVTGSMGHIPHQLIKDGLPTLISKIIQSGIPDISLMFGAIGDHECDRYPLQVAQFESGDAELDMWLTRTYLEGGGGGNAGESYPLAWYFSSYHTSTDSFDKRGKKGIVVTIGDEPFLPTYPMSSLKEIMGDTCRVQSTVTAEELLAEAGKQNEIYHIFIESSYRRVDDAWKQLLGDHLIVIRDHTEIPTVVSELVLKNVRGGSTVDHFESVDVTDTVGNVNPVVNGQEEIIL